MDQWAKPVAANSPNDVYSRIDGPREGLLICLFGGAIKGGAVGEFPRPHCHVVVAGIDQPIAGMNFPGGFPATGGHLGAARVNVVLEMQVDSYPEVIEKMPGPPDVGGMVLSVSEAQAEAARRFLALEAERAKH